MTALLHEFFDARWSRWRDLPAIDVPPGATRPHRVVMSYADLAAHSHAIGEQLRHVVRPDSVVAVLLPRTTVGSFSAPIGIMRAGAAYTSIDVSFPDERIGEVLRDASAVAVVTDAEGARRVAQLGIEAGRIITVDAEPAPGVVTDPARQPPWLTPTSLAYLIYTSGSTGRPKGVMVEHQAIANLVGSDIDEFGLRPGDRVGQTSSHAYDSSIEEIWLALAAGATLVVVDDDVARAGPDLVPWLERERITVLCPPPTLLRATGCRDSRGLLPNLRLLYVGGEALTDDVVNVWAPGRRLSNGYGPTECAVTSIRTDVVAGAPVSIGRPIPHVTASVLDDTLEPVTPGGTGELWLGGIGLARGYWNDPDLTSRKFVVHPSLGRVYRTGDLAAVAADGTISCLGRVDSQVKIRGYRIELEEIEARLAALPGVRAAACRVEGSASRRVLVAFVVSDTETPLDLDHLRSRLRETMPAYMVPGRFHLLASLPATTGGKLDRAALPILGHDIDDEPIASPQTDLESRIESALRRVADSHAPISTTKHFFRDLGGDSLLAAELITALRAYPDLAGLTVRDAYEAPTIAQLAARAAAVAPAGPDVPRSRPDHGGRPGLATLVQLSWLTAEVVAAGAVGYLSLALLWTWLAPRATLGQIALLLPALVAAGFIAYLPISLTVAVAVKRLVVGAYVPGRWPVWGGFYIRHWIVCQSLRLVPWRTLEGTVFQVWALRALGARIGERVHIHRGVDLLQGGWDLLEIGDDATIGQEAVIRLVDLDDEHLVAGHVVLGAEATIETRASVAGGATVLAGGYLTALSSLGPGASIPAGECWDGVPAQRAGLAPATPQVDANQDRPGRILSPVSHGAIMLASKLAGAAVPTVVAGLAALWATTASGATTESLTAWLRTPDWPTNAASAMVAIAIASLVIVPIAVTLQAIAIRLIGAIRPGVMSRWSTEYLRVWAKADLVRRAGDWLSGTLMWPMWLRAAGMRIGRDCEISTIVDVVPELVEIGPSTFFADGIYLGGPRVHRGTVTVAMTRLGANVFLGNHVVIPSGCTVADGVLVGVATVARDDMQASSAWFGHPPFALTRPPETYVDRRLTHDPTLIRYLNRWIWELGRFGLPSVTAMLLVVVAAVAFKAHAAQSIATMALIVAPAIIVGMGVASSALVLGLKWLLLGRVRPGQHALWSCWCSRWDFHYVAWGRLARPFLARFDGTLLLAWYLRGMGMRIGKRVVLGPGFAHVVDPDMIRIDDDVTVHALFQAHTFEDRILKIDRIRIRRRATVGCGAVLFYGVDVGEGASVSAQSVIMKAERLSPYHRYEGCPSRCVSSD